MKTEKVIAAPEKTRIPPTPHALRRIFGPHAAAIHQLIVADPGLADFVARQDKAGIHLLALAVSHGLPDRCCELRDMAVMLRSVERGKLLRRILGRRPPRGLTGVLGKLGAAPMQEEGYRRLVELLDEPSARKVLTHARRISRNMLDVLDYLPPALRLPNLARIVGKPEDFERFDYALAAVRRMRPDLDDRALRASLKSIREVDDIHGWAEWLLTRRPFAAPPWEGDELLHPVRDRRELKEVAKRFSNCLADNHMLDAVLGRKFFYIWEGEEPCVVEICPDDLVGWRTGEIEGVDNATPNPEIRARIVARLTRNGFPDLSNSNIGIWDFQ